MRRVFLLLFLVPGCSPVSTPPAERCSEVRCSPGLFCNSSTGRCEGDAGVDGGRDAGLDSGVDASVDSGAADASADAGVDSGVPDAGAGHDAGIDDAGLSGCSSDLECAGATPHCELGARVCVECFESVQCFGAAAPVCDVRTWQCVGCVSGASYANPMPACDVTQQCVGCTTSASCGAGRECDPLGQCLNLPDTCGSARTLNFPQSLGTFSFSADPSLGLDDMTVGCNASGPELVYRFTTTAVRDLALSAFALNGSNARPVLALRSSCASAAGERCDAPTSGAAGLQVSALPAGDWFIVLETANAAPGRVQLDARLTAPATPPLNDTCGAPQGLTFSAASATAIADTSLAANDSTSEPACSATARISGKDLVFSYSLATRSNVAVTVRPLVGSALHPVVAVRSGCGSGSEVACASSSLTTATQVLLPGQLAGTWFVWVDSADATSGAFQLEVNAVPTVENDVCAGSIALAFTGSTATATGDTTWATNTNSLGDQTPSCSDSARGTGRDVVFTYALTQASDVTIAATPTGSAPTLAPVISVRTVCVDATRAAERACVSPLTPTPARATLVNQPAGTYTVWVDGALDTAGTFQLEVVTSTPTLPPANDSCSAPQALVFTNETASVTGTTEQAANDNSGFDVSPTCSSTAKQTGRDVVYAFSLAQTRDVAVALTPSSGFNPALYVRRGACMSQLLADEAFCREQSGPITTSLTALPTGTWFIFVDGAGGTSGGFTLNVTTSSPTPAPANDTCSAPQSLVFSGDLATVTGTTVGATNSNDPTDNAPACGTGFLPRRFGRDLVYAYTLTGAQDLDIRVTPAMGSAFVPAVYVRAPNMCSSFSAGAELGCMAETRAAETSLYLPNQVAGTYFVFVDSNSYDTGAFTLTVRKRPATLPPANDTCSMPAPLTTGMAVMGDTAGARDDFSLGSTPTYAPACRAFLFNGRDVAYQYTATTTGNVTAILTPSATFDGALLLVQPTCSAAQCARFADTGGSGVPEALSFSVTTGQTYYLLVDNWDSSQPHAFGRFSLIVQ